MNIQKAIEIKERKGKDFLHTDPDEIEEADRLSIEALIRLEGYRNGTFIKFELPLPGETEE